MPASASGPGQGRMPGSGPGPGRARMVAADTGLALLLAGIGVAGTAGIAVHWAPAATALTGWAYALVVLAALVLAVRRLWPIATLASTTVAVSTYLVLGFPYGPIL